MVAVLNFERREIPFIFQFSLLNGFSCHFMVSHNLKANGLRRTEMINSYIKNRCNVIRN